MLRLQGVSKRFVATLAVDDASLDIEPGSRTVVIGPSGCGKTTLLRLIAGFESLDAGTVTLDDAILADGPRGIPAHRRGIGYVPQEGSLFPHLTVKDNIGFALTAQSAERTRRIEHLMALVELEPALMNRLPHEISGGQQQRVALARALAPQPKIILLDEPFSALNTQLRRAARTAVTKLVSSLGVTLILVTHDQEEALSFADQLVVMRNGKLVQVGTPVELYSHPKDVTIAGLLGDALVMEAQLRDGYAISPIGSVPTDYRGPEGPAKILIRPSQLGIANSQDDSAVKLCNGVVCGYEFRGDFYLVRVAVTGDGGKLSGPCTELSIRCGVGHAPIVNSRVGITIRGQAHVVK